ncbi:hypothetical protein [Blastococcus brunescens]|uniref:Uncharacterized protein n=1 Tax=Blastococcus brunescens TaxID=1564165 RepID=A0ABZ1B4L4_9ACTN|nr:hypothetical protein [Blastococcus sp. BMG 8361]WRL65735.1 hypothetical protein U6N30_09210 [Blastococcus sp. BMG 8361]
MNRTFGSRQAVGIAAVSALALTLTACGGGRDAGRSGDAAEERPAPASPTTRSRSASPPR